MGSNGVLLMMIIVIAAVAISWGLTIQCNDIFIQFIAPIGLVGIILALSIGNDSKKKK